MSEELERTPASLFHALWIEAETWSPSDRARAVAPDAEFDAAAGSALALEQAISAYDALMRTLTRSVRLRDDYMGRVLAIMRAIDRAFYNIHPRVLVRAPSKGARARLPAWVSEARERRELRTSYFESLDRSVIARGPLCRLSRHPVAANADTLADRFSALDVVPLVFEEAGRPISVNHVIIPVDAVRGLGPSARVGNETVSFIPVADQSSDIAIRPIARGQQQFVDFRADESLDPVNRIVDALNASGEVDIALAPELVVGEEHSEALSDALLNDPQKHRLILAGSGPTRDRVDDQPWNEARVLNGFGAQLWTQRKLWPAGVTCDLAKAYGLPDPGEGQILEDTASGSSVTIVDADGIGRCVVLICQDFQIKPMTDDLIRTYQPDWVLVPVLDYGVSIGRWSHRRALDLSCLSQARFLVSSSLSLAHLQKLDPAPPCGLAIGPFSPAADDKGNIEDTARAVATAHVNYSTRPSFATLTWRSGEWKQTTVGAS